MWRQRSSMHCCMESEMRYGYTTGSCAAAAAKAAAYMLLSGREKKRISIKTPSGIVYTPEIVDIVRREHCVSCGVIKDGGDDPDITDGAKICACVKIVEMQENHPQKHPKILIDGGNGVGRVTRPGLDQPVGNAAINHVPREMIAKEVEQVCSLLDYHGSLSVTVYVPEGESLAEKTFNPRLGIQGGISILGTSGIVEPMSTQALLETIRVELRQRRQEGAVRIAVSPGNYGQDFMRKTYGYDLDYSVKCSNFIGAAVDMAAELGYEQMLVSGHIGKLIKLAGGIMNTHSREADCRMELLAAAAIRQGASSDCAKEILSCFTTEEAFGKLSEKGLQQAVMRDLMEHISFYLDKRAAGKIKVECLVYSRELGELGATSGAKGLLEQLLAETQERNG